MFLQKFMKRKVKFVACECCKLNVKKNFCVNYADMWFCSADCLSEFMKNITTEELIRLNNIDLNR